MKRQKFGKYVTFRRFLISYIIILIIPITIGSYTYIQAMRLIENNTVNSESFMIRQSADNVDNYLSAIDLSVFTLASNSTLQSVLNMPQPSFGSDKVYQLIRVMNDMKSNNISGMLDSTTYIFLKKTDVVIDSNFANYNIRKFYENNMKYDGLSYQDWYMQVFDVTNNKTILPAHKIIENGFGSSTESYDAITYIQSIPQGAIIVQIDARNIRELLHNTVAAYNGYAFIMDDDKNIIVQSDDTDIVNTLELETLLLGEQPQHREMNGKDAIVFSLKSGYNDWNYVSVIPTSNLMGDVRHIKLTAMLDVLVILVVGSLISIFLSRSEVKPITEILSSLGKAFPGERKAKDEYSLIKDNITSLINKNNDMNESMNKLANVLLGQLLNGTIGEVQEAKNVLNNLGLNIEGKRYTVIVSTINRHVKVKAKDANTILEESIIKRIAESILVKNLNGNGCTCLIEPHQIAVILCFDSIDNEVCRQEIDEYISTINDELTETCHISFEYGIGNLYSDLPDVSFSFSEAKLALHHLDFKEIPNNIIWYSDLPVSSYQYNYPIDLERMLANMVKSGNKDEVKRLLEHVAKENFINRCLPYSMQLQLFHELKATLIKVCNEMDFDESENGIDSLKMWKSSAKDCMHEVSCVFYRLCDIINSNKKSHNKEMLEEILEYLRTNFNDPNISLYSISSGFNISSSYLSQFFKEQTGQNFSDYIEGMRIMEACGLLGDMSLTIQEITGLAGYNNPYSFRRAFKRRMGQLPNEYRSNL